MILRHITKKECLSSIINDNCLKGSNNLRKRHEGYVSFENFNPNYDRSVLLCGIANAKNVAPSELVELFFDEKKIIKSGLKVSETFLDGTRDSKTELTYYGISKEELSSVGDYRYVYGRVSLDFLTDESKKEILGSK